MGMLLCCPLTIYILPKHFTRNMSSFCLRSLWNLPLGAVNGNHDEGFCAIMQNEAHVPFHCQDLFACSFRNNIFLLFSTYFQLSCPCSAGTAV